MAEIIAGHPEWKDRVMFLEMDTSSDSSVEAAAATVKAKFGAGRVLFGIVNNAGIAVGTPSEILNINVRGPKRVDDAFVPLLDPCAGRVVQMSSGAAPGCVSRSSAERQAFFTDSSVTWDAISGVVDGVTAYPNGVQDLEAHGYGASMGVYGLSKALLNSYTMLLARQHPQLKPIR